MPPQIALLIYSSIVICLLVIEHKQTYDSSKIIWIPTFWMLIIASKPLGVWFNSNIEGSIEEGSSIDRTFLLILLFLGLLILVRRRFNLSLVVKENFWIIFLLSYMFVSIMWSDIPFISFKRWIRELLALVMAFIVSTETNPIKSLESIIRKTVYILIPFSICLIDYFPLYGRMYNRWSGDLMWIGVTMHKNSLGRLCLIAIFFIFLTLIKYWKIRIATNKKYQNYADLFIIILAIWLLKGPPGSYSATATIALLLGILSFIFILILRKLNKFISSRILSVVLLSIILFGILTPILGGSTMSGLTPLVGKNKTLTDRTWIWANILPEVLQRPILGTGYGAFWITETTEEYTVNEAHNGYLEVVMELGFVGLIINAIVIVSIALKAQRSLSIDYYWGAFGISYIFILLFYNITESSIQSFTNHLMALILFYTISNKSGQLIKLLNLNKPF